MKFIPLDSLRVPEQRQRKTYSPEHIQKLADSIARNGLYHPIVVRNDGVTLVSGECRLKAIRSNSLLGIPYCCNGSPAEPGTIPVVKLGDLSQDQIMEAELEENVLRHDLTWQDKAQAVAALHELRLRQDPNWNISKTQAEIAGKELPTRASSTSTTSHIAADLDIAAHLGDPDVARAKTKKEAVKILERKREKAHRRALAEEIGETAEVHIIEGDCLDVMDQMDPFLFDVCICDPPYGMNADTFGDMAAETHAYQDDEASMKALLNKTINYLGIVLKKAAHLYMFCDFAHFQWLRGQLESYNWNVFRTPLVWNKGTIGMLPIPDYGPRRNYELILYAYSGEKKTTGVYSDVLSVPGLSRPAFGAEKPWELYAELLKRSCLPGDSILDCFAGAGPAIPAARSLQCNITAIEINPDKVAYMRLRANEDSENEQSRPSDTSQHSERNIDSLLRGLGG